jgi:hypothetical protein
MAGERTLGVATTKAQIELGTIDGATINSSPIGGTTPAAGAFTTLSATGNVALGDAITDTFALYGKTPITQRAGAAQATSLVGTASSADVTTDLKAAIIEIQNALVAIGIWKGAA